MIRDFTPDHSGDVRTKNLSFIRSDDKYRALWQYLKRYGNPDFNDSILAKRYPKMDEELRKAKAQHVADAIRQGEAYFNTARTSELAIKPLILYYGALNLVKALLMFADNNLTLQDAAQNNEGFTTHGLTHRAKSTADKTIRDDNTKILGEYSYVTAASKTVFSLLHECWSDTPVPKGTRLELGDLASMHPRSWQSYSDFSGKPPKYFKVEGASFRTTTHGDEHSLKLAYNVWNYQATAPSGEDAWKFFESHLPRLATLYDRNSSQPYSFYTKALPKTLDEYQPTYREPTGVEFTMEDASIGQPLHLIEVEFAMLFILGSLTRYVPQKWLQNVQYSADGEMFVVEGFINSVAFNFPKLILEELESREYIFTGDVAYWS